MSVVGFDLGNETGIVAVAHQSGIHVLLNDESKCETPALVFFGVNQRSIGTAVTSSNITTNPENVVSQIKRLIGRKFADPDVQLDLQSLSFKVTEGPDGFPLIHVWYLGEVKVFTPTQILAMVLSNLKTIAEKNLNAAVVDCCIGIPIHFTDLQRRAVLDAASIAGLRPLRLLHETTASALAYGIYKTDLSDNNQLNVVFVDVGHASMQVGIVGFRKGELKILSHSYDSSLGGRDFDEVLFKYFADKFKEYKINVYQNASACIRLRMACEKLKKVLSSNPEAPLNIECSMDEKDVRGFIKREEFEKLSAPILERVKGPLHKALAGAGLTVDNVHFVEVVGSGSQVPAIIKVLREFFGKEPRRTMKASESVACGCALQCAMLIPTFKVGEFLVNESFPFSIALSWKGEHGVENNTVVFPKGKPIPSLKVLSFYRASTFSVGAVNIDHPTKISTYMIGPFQTSNGERAKIKVKVRLNIHGIVSVDAATMIEEEKTEVPVSTTNLNVVSKNKVKKTNVPVQEMVYGALPVEELQKMCEREFEMALQDRIMEETKDRNNALEARNKTNVEMEFQKREKLHQKEIEEIQKRENRKNDLLKRENEQLKLVKQELEKQISDFKIDYNKLKQERDNAIKEAQELRKQKEHSFANYDMVLSSQFSLSELEQATQNFSDSLKIGEGGFGCVYKGTLRETIVAIKKLNSESLQGLSEFQQEVAILNRVRHPNIVNLIGSCSEISTLVYEFLPNGSLEDHLACADKTLSLTWQSRTRIISEICLGLVFLHSNKPHLVIHGDLKPDNILLDANFISKLSDFGISRIIKQSDTNTTVFYSTTHPAGTFAYIDPQFLSTGKLTPKSDVYSFGIIVLRLLTGKRALDIANEVQKDMRTGRLLSIVDNSAGKWPFDLAKKLAKLGLRCADINRKKRPDMCQVWATIEPLVKAASQSKELLSVGSSTCNEEHVPSHFLCPILQEVMKNPCIAADGFTYEAEAIKKWLNGGHNTSPMTNLVLPHHDLIPNHVLRSAIQEWLQHYYSCQL